MKPFLTLLLTLLIAGVCFAQSGQTQKNLPSKNNTTKNNLVNENKIISDSLNTNKQNNPSMQEVYLNNEGTNDPTTTGSVKHVVNGKEVYVKENEINGIKSTVIYKPK